MPKTYEHGGQHYSRLSPKERESDSVLQLVTDYESMREDREFQLRLISELRVELDAVRAQRNFYAAVVDNFYSKEGNEYEG